MRQLIVKHLRDQALLAVLLGAVAITSSWVSLLAASLQAASTGAALSAPWFLTGVLLGADALERDRRGSMRQYLAHRGLSARRQFAARGGAATLLLAGLVAFAIALFALRALDPEHEALRAQLPVHLAVVGVAASSSLWGLAIGLLTAAFVRTRWRLAIALILAGFGAWELAKTWQSAVGDVLAPNEWTWIGSNVVASACVLRLAAEVHCVDRDPSRPLPGRVRSIAGLAVLALASAPLRWRAETLCDSALRWNAREQPAIALAGGKLTLVEGDDPSEAGQATPLLKPLDLLPRRPWLVYPGGYVTPARTGFEFGPAQLPMEVPPQQRFAVEHLGALFVPELSFDRRAWQVRASFARVDERWNESSKLPRVVAAPDFNPRGVTTLERPDGRSFSRQLEYVPRHAGGASFLLTDSGDLTLWTVAYSGIEPHLTKLELPDGDEWMGWDQSEEYFDDLDGLFARRGPRLRGRNGLHEWTSSGFVRVAPKPAAGFTVRFLDDDVLAPHVEVVHPSGAPRFEHRYGASPRWTALALLATTLDAPAVTLADFVRPAAALAPPDERPSLVASGRRPWLLALHVALGLVCAHWLARRQTFGLSRVWWALALLVGPATAALAVVLEPRPKLASTPLPPRRLILIATGRTARRRRTRPGAGPAPGLSPDGQAS